jgi:UDP-N-acetylglucosamine--N-acetylmuramyl-(pentapeptide) pyrophosphoryl-undecaprenol N-acetylglucosamine transferase
MRDLRVIIAGGGTGGHIFPAVAIGHALMRMRPGTELLFVGAKGKMEMEKVPQEGFSIVGLDIAGFNRSHLLKNISLPFKLLKSYFKARRILRDFGADAVIGVGGYASFPMLRAAQQQGTPTVIQEQNSYAGKSNKILGRKARAICVAYEKMDRFFPVDRLFLTGNPVRKIIAQSTVSREEGQAWLGLDSSKKTLLVVGGSLGAASINEAIGAGLEEVIAMGMQIIWQTGKPYHAKALGEIEGKESLVKVYDFIREMDYAYAAADLIISRAGALAISELCIVSKPVIFVPYPFAAEDHQTSNALSLVEHNAALMVKDNECRTELVKKLKHLVADEDMQALMRRNLSIMAIRDADERIAGKVLELTTEKMAG